MISNLTKYDVASIGIKLLAIYLAVFAINILSNSVLVLVDFYEQSSSDSSIHPFGLKFLCLFFWFLITLAMPILLWVFSGKIARFATKIETDSVAVDDSVKNLQETLICVAGICIFVVTIPDLLVFIFGFIETHIQSREFSQSLWSSLSNGIALLLKVVLSFVLTFKARNISHWLIQLRYAGIKS